MKYWAAGRHGLCKEITMKFLECVGVCPVWLLFRSSESEKMGRESRVDRWWQLCAGACAGLPPLPENRAAQSVTTSQRHYNPLQRNTGPSRAHTCVLAPLWISQPGGPRLLLRAAALGCAQGFPLTRLDHMCLFPTVHSVIFLFFIVKPRIESREH